MFDFIKKLFSKKPVEEPVIEVAVKPKRVSKPRAPKVQEAVQVVAEPAVVEELKKPVAKKKPVTKPAESKVVAKPENKPKPAENKPPRGRKVK